MQAARAQQTVGEHMAAFGVGAKLDLVDGKEIGAHALGHRLDRADPVLGTRRHDAFLAGDQRHHRGAAQGHDLVVNLARQKTQRQADHPGAVAQHPLDRVMRFAGVCRAKNGHDAR